MRASLFASPLALVPLLGLAACGGCSEAPADPPTPECVLDIDCGNHAVCAGGTCVAAGEDAGTPGDAGIPDDAGSTLGILTALPEDSVEFGAVRLGTPVERNITLKNTGAVSLRVLQIVVDDDQGVFVAEPAGFIDTELAPDAEIGVALTHIPNDGVPDSAELEVLHTGEGGILNIDLFAEFKGTPTLSITESVAILEPDVDAIDFGDVPSGSASSRRLLVRNDGSPDSVLEVSGIIVTPASGAFTAVAPDLDPPLYLSAFDGACLNSSTCPASAPDCVSGFCVDAAGVPPDTIPIHITFAPTASGSATATLTLTTSDGGHVVQRDVALTGRGVTGLVVVTPATVIFADAFVGRTQRATINVANEGGAPIAIDAFEIVPAANSPFAVEHSLPLLPYTMAASERFDIDVVFTPQAPGQFARSLAIRIDGEQDTFVEIVGNARVPPIIDVLDEATLTDLPDTGVPFFDVYTGFSAQKTIRIINRGPPGSVLHVLRIAIAGPQAGRFTVSPPNLDDLPLSGSVNLEPHAELDITYLPGPLTGFNDTATLIIESDDPNHPTVEIPLSGRSVQPIIEVSAAAIDFGPVLVGTSPSPFRDVTIRNGGFGPLVISQITPPSQSEFALSGAGPASLEFGETTTFRVTFTPTQAVFLTSFIDIISSDLTRPIFTIALGGGGADCPPRANATVDQSTGECIYTCNSGFHACGDVCASNTSPDSCGTSCTPCATRSNTVRGCNASTSTCTYSCTTTFFDLNGDISVPQGTGSDGCEYQCDFANPTSEQCDDLDNDCDGTDDDNLPLETNEPPNFCTNSAVDFGDVDDNNQPVTFTGFKLYDPARNGGDEDWFKFRAHEEEFNFCIGSEPYRTTIELRNIPAGRDYDLEVRDQGCGGARFFSLNGSNENEIIQLDWSGSCGSDDNRTFFIRVFPFPPGGLDSCDDYTIRLTHDRR